MVIQRQYFFLIAFCSCGVIKATDYLAIGLSENFLEPCTKEDDRGNMHYEDFMDVSKVNQTYSEDWEKIIYNGVIEVKTDLVPANQAKKIKIESDIYSWQRGEWVKTLWSLHRNDFCGSFESPMEFWYPIVMKIPKEQRVCPPRKGLKYTMNNTTNYISLKNMPTRDLEGEYKAVSHMKVDDKSLCTMIRFIIKKE